MEGSVAEIQMFFKYFLRHCPQKKPDKNSRSIPNDMINPQMTEEEGVCEAGGLFLKKRITYFFECLNNFEWK